MRRPSPSQRYIVPNLASQRRVALASTASKTGCRSPRELERVPAARAGKDVPARVLSFLLLRILIAFVPAARLKSAGNRVLHGRPKLVRHFAVLLGKGDERQPKPVQVVRGTRLTKQGRARPGANYTGRFSSGRIDRLAHLLWDRIVQHVSDTWN